MVEKVDILAIGAHPDDIELSAGASLAKHVSLGKKVAIVDLTEGELGTRGTVEERYQEAADAAEILGVSYRENIKLEDGFFENNKENLIKLITQIRRFQPEIVLANAPEDRHPDHGRANEFISRACFLSGLRKIKTSLENQEQAHWRPKAVYYYIQDRYLSPDFVIDVTDHVEKKFDAIKAYKSQFYHPGMTGPKTPISGKEFFDYLESRMLHFGRSINVKYAEGYIVERTPGVTSFFDLI